MARRRKAKTRTITRYVKRKAKRRRSGSSGVKMLQMDAIAYGAVRGMLSNLLVPITSKIPLGNMADEIGVGLFNYFVAKNSSGMIRNIATKGLIIENAMLGSELTNQFSKKTTAQTPTMAINY